MRDWLSLLAPTYRGRGTASIAAKHSAAARSLAARHDGFDFTTASLDIVEQALLVEPRKADTDDYADYVGEVLLRSFPGGQWIVELRHRRLHPVIQWYFSPRERRGKRPRTKPVIVDPRRLVRCVVAGEHTQGLRVDVETALRWLEAPSPETEAAAGIKWTVSRNPLPRWLDMFR
jgi:hypothetical protein